MSQVQVLTKLIELRLPRTGTLHQKYMHSIEPMNKIGLTKKHSYLKGLRERRTNIGVYSDIKCFEDTETQIIII